MSEQGDRHAKIDQLLRSPDYVDPSSCTCDPTPDSAGQGPSMRGHDEHCPVRINLTRTIHQLSLCSCVGRIGGRVVNLDDATLDLLAWDISDAFAKDVGCHGLDFGLDEIKAALPAFIVAIQAHATGQDENGK